MILLLPLQEFMSLISAQKKLLTSSLCFIFYVDSLHAVSPKMFHPSVCIELMVSFTPTIPWSALYCVYFPLALSVPSFGVALDCLPT
ncbi:hypothetical protein BHM03_00023710 [Ensete ventricosum]|nr:hypothetical protein BHM03_00023710 [Ensete ventricosum]